MQHQSDEVLTLVEEPLFISVKPALLVSATRFTIHSGLTDFKQPVA